MKKISLLLIVFVFALMADAQTAFDNYYKKVPALPPDSCNITKADAESFVQKVTTLTDELTNDIEERNRKTEDYAEQNRGAMENNAVKRIQQQTGMSDEEINKLKNSKNMSQAEKQALANKMLMQQTNISMDEIKNLSKMSEAGKKAYAEAYAIEAQANAQANPQGYSKQVGMSQNARTLIVLQQEQQALLNKIMTGQKKIANMYAAIENDPSGKIMTDNIAKWNSILMSMMGEVSKKESKMMDSLSLLIKKEQIRYCDKFTPKYRTVLRQDLANVKASLPDCQRFDEVSGELMKAQTGVAPAPEMREATSLKALNGYLGNLKNAYKYKLYYSEDN